MKVGVCTVVVFRFNTSNDVVLGPIDLNAALLCFDIVSSIQIYLRCLQASENI